MANGLEISEIEPSAIKFTELSKPMPTEKSEKLKKILEGTDLVNDLINDTDKVFGGENFLETFRHRGFLSNEPWDSVQNFQGRVVKSEGSLVTCELLLDKNNVYIESRVFSKNLFSHISNLNNNPFVIVTLKEKQGSSRIDIIDGEMQVQKEYFATKNLLDMMDEDIHDKLDGPIDV